MQLKRGDLVTRKSYNHDTIFKITNIKNDIYYLKGIEDIYFKGVVINENT